MLQVWKCDFCNKSDLDPHKISIHEKECSFNKVNKTCWTCKFRYTDAYGDPNCELDLDQVVVDINNEYTHCGSWVYEKLDEDRDNKLNDIGI